MKGVDKELLISVLECISQALDELYTHNDPSSCARTEANTVRSQLRKLRMSLLEGGE